MNALFTGIKTLFDAAPGGVHNDCYTAVGGRLYLVESVQNPTFPYIVMHNISNLNDFNFTSKEDSIILQFNIFSQSSTTSEAGTILGYLRSLFDFASPTVSGYTVVHMNPYSINGPIRLTEDRIWMYIARYKIMLRKAK